MKYFQRKEVKYMLTKEQADGLLSLLQTCMVEDVYSPYSIASLYFDTKHDDLMKQCTDKPACRMKVRLRSYGTAGMDSPVFFEIKKKVKGVTCKKREDFVWSGAKLFLHHPEKLPFTGMDFQQLTERYHLIPRSFISYDRQAWYWKDDPEIRITFDTNLLIRHDHLDLETPGGMPVLKDGQVLLEIKAGGAVPYPIARALSLLGIRPCSFSKATTAFLQRAQQGSAGTKNKVRKPTNPEKRAAVRMDSRFSAFA